MNNDIYYFMILCTHINIFKCNFFGKNEFILGTVLLVKQIILSKRNIKIHIIYLLI